MKTLVDVKARKRDLLAACAAMCGKDSATCTARAMLQQSLVSVRRYEIGARIQRTGRPAAILESIAFDMASRHDSPLRDWQRIQRVAFHYGAEMLDGYLMSMKAQTDCN